MSDEALQEAGAEHQTAWKNYVMLLNRKSKGNIRSISFKWINWTWVRFETGHTKQITCKFQKCTKHILCVLFKIFKQIHQNSCDWLLFYHHSLPTDRFQSYNTLRKLRATWAKPEGWVSLCGVSCIQKLTSALNWAMISVKLSTYLLGNHSSDCYWETGSAI